MKHFVVAAVAALLVAIAAFLPVAAAPFSFSYTFTNEKTSVSGGVLQSDGTFVPGTFFERRASDGAFFSSGSTVSYLDVSFALEKSLSVQLQQGQVLTSDATGDESDDTSAFRLYCEGTQGQLLAGKAQTVLFRLLDASGAVLGSARSTVQHTTPTYVYAPVPRFEIERAGVLASVSCIVELSSTFSGDVTVFFGGRTWSFTLSTPGDPANPDYSSPNTSGFDEYNSLDQSVQDGAQPGIDSGAALLAQFPSYLEGFRGGLLLLTNMFTALVPSEVLTVLGISLMLGIVGTLFGLGSVAFYSAHMKPDSDIHRRQRASSVRQYHKDMKELGQ